MVTVWTCQEVFSPCLSWHGSSKYKKYNYEKAKYSTNKNCKKKSVSPASPGAAHLNDIRRRLQEMTGILCTAPKHQFALKVCFFSCPGSSIPDLGHSLTDWLTDCHFWILTQRVTFDTWDPSDIYCSMISGQKDKKITWQHGKKTTWHKDKKAKRQKDKKTKWQKDKMTKGQNDKRQKAKMAKR